MEDFKNDDDYLYLDECFSGIDWSTMEYRLDHGLENQPLDDLLWIAQGIHRMNPHGEAIIAAMVAKYWTGHMIAKEVPVIFPPRDNVAVREVIPNWLSDAATDAIAEGKEWMAYNGSLYFPEREGIEFFHSKFEAISFASDNISDVDNYNVKPISYINQLAYIMASDKQTNFLSFENQEIMNKENFEYLAKNVMYMGFGETLKDELKNNIERANDNFQLNFKGEFNKKPFEATLNFRKSDKSDVYFFNSYRATMERNDGQKVDQLFYINNGRGVTAKEAFNLLDGRAVHKELETKEGAKYHAWMQLDFENKDKHQNHVVKQYHENFGFDLKEAVAKLPVTELDGGDREKQLLHSLEKGNVQAVNFDMEGVKRQMFIEANPAYKSIHVYDSDMKRVVKEELTKYKKPEQAVEGAKQGLAKDDKKKALKSEDAKSLLPKKRVREGKGLSV